MPTKRLPKFSADSQRTETKENISSALLVGKVAGGRMTRKRSRSEPGDGSNADAAVLRLSQEANNPSAGQSADQNDGNEANSRRVNSARLYALSLQKVSARKPGKSKRIKISSDNDPPVEAQSSEGGRGAAASVSACEQSFARMYVNRCNASPTAIESNVMMWLPQRTVSKLSLRSRKSEQPGTNSALNRELSSPAAEDGEHVNNENKCQTIANRNDRHTTNAVEEIEPLKIPVVAPALKNLGNTCFLNSVLQVLYYTPTFVDNVSNLCKEMKTTITDNNKIRNITHCETKLLSKHCSFIFRLNQLFNEMRNAEQQFLNGGESEAIIPGNLLVCLAKMSPLFHDHDQQDGHECLRCILLYIQEATRAMNQQRAIHRDITQSDSSNDGIHISAVVDADTAAETEDMHMETSSGSLGSSPSSAFRQPDSVNSVSPTAGSSMATKVSTLTPEHDCLFKSSPGGSSSSQNPAVPEPNPHTPDSAKSTPSNTNLSTAAAKRMPTVGKITDYFSCAPPAPRTVSEITVNASKVPDFVEALCEGKSERRTRCLECECVTRCTETFQDVDVVAQKACSRAKASIDDGSDNDRHNGIKEKCWIVKSLEEVELLNRDNKYLCSECLHHTEADRSVTYQQLPQILTIHIKRFTGMFGGGYTKFMACVNIPFVLPCLEVDCKAAAAKSKHIEHWYELYAVVCHSGISLSSGHYSSYVRAPPANAAMALLDDGEHTDGADTEPVWFICNDDVVTALHEGELKQKLSVDGATTPYMLFYRRISA